MDRDKSYDAEFRFRINNDDWQKVIESANALDLSALEYVRLIVTVPIILTTTTESDSHYLNDSDCVFFSICDTPTFLRYRKVLSSWRTLLKQIDKALDGLSMKRFYPEERRVGLKNEIDEAILLTREYHKKFDKYFLRNIVPYFDYNPEQKALNKSVHVRLFQSEKDLVWRNAELFDIKPSHLVRNLSLLPFGYTKRLLTIRESQLLMQTIQPKIVCSKLVLMELVEALRKNGYALSRSAKAFNTIRDKPAMAAAMRRETYETGLNELRYIYSVQDDYDNYLTQLGEKDVYMWR